MSRSSSFISVAGILGLVSEMPVCNPARPSWNLDGGLDGGETSRCVSNPKVWEEVLKFKDRDVGVSGEPVGSLMSGCLSVISHKPRLGRL